MKKIVLASLLATAFGAASAQGYIGGSAGLTSFDVDCDGTTRCDTSDAGLKLYAGYKFNPAFALELGYLDFGKVQADGYLAGYVGGFYFSSPTFMSTQIDVSGVTVSAALRGAFTPALNGVLRLGIASITTESSAKLLGSSGSASETNAAPYLGLGLEYAFTKNLKGTVSADFSRFEVDGETGSVRMVGIGAQYDF